MNFKVTPNFLLKGIDVEEVMKSLFNGEFSKITSPLSIPFKIKLISNSSIFVSSYSTDVTKPIFNIRERNNIKLTVATTGNEGITNTVQRCDNCKGDVETNVGIPIDFKPKQILEATVEHPEGVYRIHYEFETDGIHCCFECALEVLNKAQGTHHWNREPLYDDDSRVGLFMMYELMYPNGPPLVAATDYRLLCTNNGSISEQEFHDRKHKYIRTPIVRSASARVEYIKCMINDTTHSDD